MKILGISGSNRKNGSSYLFLKEVFNAFPSLETRIIQMAELSIKPCELCFERCARKPFKCVIEDDFPKILEEMVSADGIVIACPFYFYIPSRFQALLERFSCLDYFTEERHGRGISPLAGKPCGLITVSASGSGSNALQIFHHLQEFVLMLRMRLVTMDFWPFIGVSVKSGGVKKEAVLGERNALEQAKEMLHLLIKSLKGR